MLEVDKAELARSQMLGELLAFTRDFRAAHTGGDPDVLYPEAKEALQAIGVQLTDDQIRDYARSVSSDQAFLFRLK